MRYALIRAGIVANLIVADGAFIAAIADRWEGVVDVTDADPQPGVGWSYDGATFAPPPPASAPDPSPVPIDRLSAARDVWDGAADLAKTAPLTAIAIALGIVDPS